MKKVAILIPCYNEEVTIAKVISDFKKELPEADIYVYNNNSTDNTLQIAYENGAIVKNEYRQGKGNVVRSMFRDVEADIYVLVDGDDTYPAKMVHQLIKPILLNTADMVVGDRISNGTYKKQNKRLFHDFGNGIVKNTINKLFKCNLKDVMSGYRAFSKAFVKNVPILSKGFEVETEITLHALDKGFIIKEIPIEYKNRPSRSVSKLNTFSDGYKVIKTIIKMLKDYKPLKFFIYIAIIFFIFGLVIGIPVIYEYALTRYISKVPSAVLSTGLMIFSVIIAQCGVILDTVVKDDKEKYELELNKYVNLEKIAEKVKEEKDM